MKAGDTFRPTDPDVDIHLWVVISDPELDGERVLAVSMTTYKAGKEPTCLLQPGDHPFINRETCIYYQEPLLISTVDFETLVNGRHLIPDQPVSPEILDRIRASIWDSKRFPDEHIELMDQQGLLP